MHAKGKEDKFTIVVRDDVLMKGMNVSEACEVMMPVKPTSNKLNKL